MAKIELKYIEIDGLLYPHLATGMENIESSLGKYDILRLRYLMGITHKKLLIISQIITKISSVIIQ